MPITDEEVEAATRQWLGAFEAGDLDGLAAMEAGAGGFGYRTRSPRALGDSSEFSIYRAALDRLAADLERWHVEPLEIRTSVLGDVGFAWGSYVEEFQHRGRPPERARVRFSHTLTKTPEGWRMLLFHRDIQPFDAAGRYPRALTADVPDTPD